jgi:signal transduction histidine kinase
MPDRTLSILSLLRRGLQFEVFQDFQEVLFESFHRPSVVLIRQTKDSLKACFPRKRVPVPREFYHHLFDIIDPSQLPRLLEEDEMKVVRAGLNAEDNNKAWKWGWRTNPLGLVDLYFPIRLRPEPNSADATVAVLIVGKLRAPSDSISDAGKWMDNVILGDQGARFVSRLSAQERKDHSVTLHALFSEIPVVDHRSRQLIEREVITSVRLLQLTLNRVLHTARLFSTEDFIHSLGLGQPGLHITKRELWNSVEGALARIKSHLGLSTAVLYSSTYSDYTDMKAELKLGIENRPTPDSLGLASYSEFEWLQSQDWTILPVKGEQLSWLDPTSFFGSDNAIIFGREMIGGHLVLLGFGMSRRVWLSQTQKAALYEAVTARVFRFIENALFRIELDHLLAETGHLMGRAVGKVKSGADVIIEILSLKKVKPAQENLVRSAQWSLQDGLMRLNLIRQNFYSFGSERLNTEHEPADAAHHVIHENRSLVDAPKVLGGMKSFFDRAADEAKLKPIRYLWLCESAVTVGRESDLQLVFLNIFDNALKFAYANTYISISVIREKDRCVVDFTNLGVGVANDEAKRMFRRLARSRYKDPSKRIEGLGLGLSYCQRVISDIFQGTVELTSRDASKPGQKRFDGDNWLTSVVVSLPIREVGSD